MAPKEASCLRDLLIIRRENREKIDAINQNLGSALGYKYVNGQQTQHPSIIVFVPDKIEEKLIPSSQVAPKELEAAGSNGDILYCKTDIVRGGKTATAKEPPPLTKENQELVEELRKGRIGLVGGVQLGGIDENGQGYVGTAACAVTDKNGRKGFLTNQHVAGPPGRVIYHPRPGQYPIGKSVNAIEYKTDENHYGGIVDEHYAAVRVDSAFIWVRESVDNAIHHGLHKLGSLGETLPIDIDTMDIIGTQIVSIGRTRGIQKGIIVAYSYEWFDSEKWSIYTDLLIIGEQAEGAFSDKGDSGKLIVTVDGKRPVALLWGGWQERLRKGYEQENWTYAIEVSKVLKYLDLEIMR